MIDPFLTPSTLDDDDDDDDAKSYNIMEVHLPLVLLFHNNNNNNPSSSSSSSFSLAVHGSDSFSHFLEQLWCESPFQCVLEVLVVLQQEGHAEGVQVVHTMHMSTSEQVGHILHCDMPLAQSPTDTL